VVDFKFVAKRKTSVEKINAAIIKASKRGPLKGILAVTDQPNVSIDFNHDPASSTFALPETKVLDDKLVSILTWYDNEWGFSNRMGDSAVSMGALL
jgi:glyceraldehyde 3-phosphate dehydrogenase